MSELTLVIYGTSPERALRQLAEIPASYALSKIILMASPNVAEALRHSSLNEGRSIAAGPTRDVRVIDCDTYLSGAALIRLLAEAAGDDLLLLLPGPEVRLSGEALGRFLSVGKDTAAGIVYADYRREEGNETIDYPTIDHQMGSIRDDFDFGRVIWISSRAIEEAQGLHGMTDSALRWGALYDLRLKIATNHLVLRIPEFLYSCWKWKSTAAYDRSGSGEPSYGEQFEYLDPRKREYQIEMERIATRHLRRIGAYLEPAYRPLREELEGEKIPSSATVVIPVRNRERTIAEAVRSALDQSTTFPFNVLVIDNHSTDRTTSILQELARKESRLIHRIPDRSDLGIGGCWNEAIYSAACGRYAVQLDSDDLYADEHTLQKMVARLEEAGCAMVIGSYTLVDFELNEIPPGLIDHREWTRENGRNNALRINGLGAPRAFHVPTLRRYGFPNVSYGEDYAVALRISRDYEVGRIFESVYLCRRWAGNSDAELPRAVMNRYDSYKDRVRTIEILARIRRNAES